MKKLLSVFILILSLQNSYSQEMSLTKLDKMEMDYDPSLGAPLESLSAYHFFSGECTNLLYKDHLSQTGNLR